MLYNLHTKLFLIDFMEKIVYSTAEIADTLEDMIKDGATVPLCVSGTSMRPFLLEGRDVVWLGECKPVDFKRGRILLFKRNDGTLVLHRIRKVLQDGSLLMNGDAQTWCETILQTQAIACVSEIERPGKKTSCESFAFKLRSEIWQLLMPLRSLLLRFWRKLFKY